PASAFSEFLLTRTVAKIAAPSATNSTPAIQRAVRRRGRNTTPCVPAHVAGAVDAPVLVPNTPLPTSTRPAMPVTPGPSPTTRVNDTPRLLERIRATCMQYAIAVL